MKKEFMGFIEFLGTKILNANNPLTKNKLKKILKSEMGKLKDLYNVIAINS